MSSEKKKESQKGQNDKQKEMHEWNKRAKEIWLAGLGALSVVEEEGSKLFRSLVEKGTSYEEKRKDQVDELWKEISERYEKAGSRVGETFEKAEDRLEQRLKAIITSLGIPSRKEIEELSNKVDALNKKIDKMRDNETGSTEKEKKGPRKKSK